MAEPAESAETPAPKKSKKKLFVLVGALVILLGAGGAGAWYFTRDTGAGKPEAAAPKVPVFLALDTFTVNLQDGEQYLQLDITLQVADQAQIDAIKLHMPRVRSRLLSLLSSKHPDELMSPEDKKKLTAEILAQVKQPLEPKGKPQQIEDVLFTSFVIQ